MAKVTYHIANGLQPCVAKEKKAEGDRTGEQKRTWPEDLSLFHTKRSEKGKKFYVLPQSLSPAGAIPAVYSALTLGPHQASELVASIPERPGMEEGVMPSLKETSQPDSSTKL